MPRYFFHRRSSSGFVEDTEGDDLSSLDAAREEAIEAARELMSEEVREGIAPDDSQFEIVDERGRVLEIVRFGSVLRHK